MAIFFNGVGLSLGEKLVPTNDRPSYSSIVFRLFQAEARKIIAPHFARTGWRYAKACL